MRCLKLNDFHDLRSFIDAVLEYLRKETVNVFRRYGLLDSVDEEALALGLPEVPYFDQILQPKRLIKYGVVVGIFMFFLIPVWGGNFRVLWVGITFAFFGYIFAASINLRNRIKQHTFDLLVKTRFDEIFINSETKIHLAYFRKKEISKNDAKRIYNKPDKDDIEFRKSLATVFNIYEIIAISIYYKDANERITKEYYQEMIVSDWKKFWNLLSLYRGDLPSAFLYLEWLCGRWGDDA